ncbi:MAG TPA: DUF1232 domain-containing protein [Polyangiales bacterium]|nr:DUF1232 domain-containing protein [Polyangiales bacterium]
MSATLTANLEERIDDSVRQRVQHQVAEFEADHLPESTAPLPKQRFSRFLEEKVAKRLGHRHLVKLVTQRGHVMEAWRELPDRMHRVANQTKLMMELIDDYRSGAYRHIPWHSLAVGAAAILYVANPADVLPEALLGIGMLDDIAVAALAARVLRNDLKAYCAFKGYPVTDYFTEN